MKWQMQWQLGRLSSNSKTRFRQIATAIRRQVEDEGDWFHSSEWWGYDSDPYAHSVLRDTSLHGNGVVSVLAYPSSRPSAFLWPKTENWLRQRCAEICPDSEHEQLKVLGYQWRVLRFNDVTRQSAVKVLAACKASDPGSVYYMQQGYCLAVPYIKSMVSAGLTTLSCCNYDLLNAVNGQKEMRVLCIGHGGGSLPLFLASKIKGAVIDIVEIDPLVISASIHAMGFPSFSVTHSSHRAPSTPNTIDEVLWRGIHQRLFLYESDAEKFILDRENLYDIIFIDAYDGDDVFPRKLWDPDYPFLKALSSSLHPCHGTVVVNLHSDADVLDPDVFIASNFEPVLPMGRYVSEVCQAYKDMLMEKQSFFSRKQCAGLGFAVSVPWVCNTTLVVCKGFCMSSGAVYRDSVLNALISESLKVDRDLDLPFSCLQYLKRGFVLLN